MKLILKLCLVAAIWAFGLYQGAIAYSDPAGQAWAELIPKVIALVLSIPICISIARTTLAQTARHRKLKRALLWVPLAIATSPILIAAIVVGWPVLLIGGVAWVALVVRKKRKAKRDAIPPAPRREEREKNGAPAHLSTTERHSGDDLGPRSGMTDGDHIYPAVKQRGERKHTRAPRTRKPTYGIWAWILPPLGIPLGVVTYLLGCLCDFEGYDAWLIFAWALAPLFIALCVSPILAIAALCRRERHPWLPASLLALHAVWIAVFTWTKWETPLPTLVGVAALAAWIFWRHRGGGTATEHCGTPPSVALDLGDPAEEPQTMPATTKQETDMDNAQPAPTSKRTPFPHARRTMQIVLGVSLAYSAFVWFWAIRALQWYGTENWAAVMTGVLGMFGGIAQLIGSTFVTRYALTRDVRVYTRLPRAWDLVAIQLGWILSAIAFIVGLCS